MDSCTPTTWRLDWRDLRDHRVGQARPKTFHKRFRSEAGAHQKLEQLRAVPGAVVVGFITEVPGKPVVEQTDFGFPLGGERRMTD